MQAQLTRGLQSRRTGELLKRLYGGSDTGVLVARERLMALYGEHVRRFGRKDDVRFFSAPGRTELAGNHTDHNAGRVLAAAVNLDSIMAASKNDTGIITLHSQGYADPIVVDTADLSQKPQEEGTATAMVRGVCARFAQLGKAVGGFDSAQTSNVLVGSGLSSSAAFEVMIAAALDGLYNAGDMPGIQKAQVAQFAENRYFGKPCGLMDQAASAIGGLTAFDFETAEPQVQALQYDFEAKGYSLVVVNTGSSHDDLTDHYAAIPEEMKRVAACFGKQVLRELSMDDLMADLPRVRSETSDRAVLRAMHFFADNDRVSGMVEALKIDDIQEYFRLCIESGDSSWRLLQNVYADPSSQPLTLALAVSERLLNGHGAWRVHGGGFAGTIQAFVPRAKMHEYLKAMGALFGPQACCVLAIRPVGAAELVIKPD